MRFHSRLALLICVLLSACATPATLSPEGTEDEIKHETRLQKELIFNQALSEEKRMFDVAFPILLANDALCPDRGYLAGLSVTTIDNIGKPYRAAAKRLNKLDKRPRIVTLIKNSPIEQAGIQRNDVVLKINGKDVPTGEDAGTDIDVMLKKIEGQNIDITVLRGNKEITRTVKRRMGCAYEMVYDPSDLEINAYADGERIFMTRGMMRFVKNDTELALVLAHEIAHNAMKHSEKKNQNAALAGMGGLAVDILLLAMGGAPNGAITDNARNAGRNAYSVSFEQEADYVGMYMMMRTGYDAKGVANFWRRMAAEHSAGALIEMSHPSSPARFLAIEKTYQEIAAKQKKKLPLVPNAIGSGE